MHEYTDTDRDKKKLRTEREKAAGKKGKVSEREGRRRSEGIMSLNGKVALVTGGAQGIGRAVVQSLLQSSAKVSTAHPALTSQLLHLPLTALTVILLLYKCVH